MVEKPKVEEAPSNLAVFGRYLFTPKIFSVLETLKQGKDNEYWITDAIEQLIKIDSVATCQIQNGRWVTTGDPINYMEAILEYAKDRPELQQIINNHQT
jgi:UTP--glucose-1-phosphate uridylyltransferase